MRYLEEKCKKCTKEKKKNCIISTGEDIGWEDLYFFLLNRYADKYTKNKIQYYANLYYLYSQLVLILVISLFSSIALLFLLSLNPARILFSIAIFIVLAFVCIFNKGDKYLENSFIYAKIWFKLNKSLLDDVICKK